MRGSRAADRVTPSLSTPVSNCVQVVTFSLHRSRSSLSLIAHRPHTYIRQIQNPTLVRKQICTKYETRRRAGEGPAESTARRPLSISVPRADARDHGRTACCHNARATAEAQRRGPRLSHRVCTEMHSELGRTRRSKQNVPQLPRRKASWPEPPSSVARSAAEER